MRGVYNGIQWKGTGNNRKSSRWVISILRSVLSRCQQEFALDFLLMSVRIPIIPGLVSAYVGRGVCSGIMQTYSARY